MHYEGNCIRPPSEAYSILIQVTVGCSHNKCSFCGTYKDKRFRIKDDRTILSDIKKSLHLLWLPPQKMSFPGGWTHRITLIFLSVFQRWMVSSCPSTEPSIWPWRDTVSGFRCWRQLSWRTISSMGWWKDRCRLSHLKRLPEIAAVESALWEKIIWRNTFK